jgi:hypothetical protein
VNAAGELVIDSKNVPDLSNLGLGGPASVDAAIKRINDWFKHKGKKLKGAKLKGGEVTLEKTAIAVAPAPPAVAPIPVPEKPTEPKKPPIVEPEPPYAETKVPQPDLPKGELFPPKPTTGTPPPPAPTPEPVKSTKTTPAETKPTKDDKKTADSSQTKKGCWPFTFLLLLLLTMFLGAGVGFTFLGGPAAPPPATTAPPVAVATVTPAPSPSPSPSPSASPSPSPSPSPSTSPSPSPSPTVAAATPTATPVGAITGYCVRVVHQQIPGFLSYLDWALYWSGADVEYFELTVLGGNNDESVVLTYDPVADGWRGNVGLREAGDKRITSVVAHLTNGESIDVTDAFMDEFGFEEFTVRFPQEDAFGCEELN